MLVDENLFEWGQRLDTFGENVCSVSPHAPSVLGCFARPAQSVALPKQTVVVDLFKDVEFAADGGVQDFASAFLISMVCHAVAQF